MTDSNQKHTVAILARAIPHYRKKFYEKLRSDLAARNIELRLFYGQLEGADAKRKVEVEIPWGVKRKNRVLRLGSRELYYQPCLGDVLGADLVIAIQESKLLLNYLLFLAAQMGIVRLAFWGHGRNFKEESSSRLGEGLKKFMSKRVAWWFAYNNKSSSIVEQLGFPTDRITVVENSVDTQRLVELREQITAAELHLFREQMGLRGNNVCIYAGSLYREKRLDCLLQSSVLLRERIPDFELLIVGAGAEQPEIERFCSEHPWAKYLGPRYDHDLAVCFRAAKLLLIPGGVGLSALDSFALATPLVSTQDQPHGPEVEYLESGKNCWIVDGGANAPAYAAAVADILLDQPRHSQLVAGCLEAAQRYTIERMSDNFLSGILKAIERHTSSNS